MNISTITLDVNIKNKLDKLKAHHRESYNELIKRLILEISNKSKEDVESLHETIEILSDPDTMKSLARSLQDLKRGALYSIDEV